MEYTTRWIVAAVMAGVGMGCGPGTTTTPAPETPTTSPTPEGPESANGAATAPAPTSDTPPEAAVPARDPVPAADTLPDGLTQLTDDEAQEAESKCAGLSKALAGVVKADKSGRPRTEVLLEALKSGGVSAPGVDVARCGELISRDLLIYRARMIESEAINNIKMISVGLASASNGEPPKVCPSAGPTPPELSALEKGPVSVPADGWSAPGWSCVRFASQVPVRFQYELRVDAAAKSYEIIARGFPVAGQPAVELFQKGTIEGGKIRPSSNVMRK